VALPQQKFREIVFQLLYSYDMGASDVKSMITLIMKELSVSKGNVERAQQCVEAVKAHQEEIDEKIRKAASSYDFSRIQSVERNILRLGIYEMLFDDAIPEKVAISESMRLARKFSTPEASGFVNAVMDVVYKKTCGLKVDEKIIEEQYNKLIESEEIASQSHEQQLGDNDDSASSSFFPKE